MLILAVLLILLGLFVIHPLLIVGIILAIVAVGYELGRGDRRRLY